MKDSLRIHSVKVFKALLYIVIMSVSIEAACQIAYRVSANKWLFLQDPSPHSMLFEKHPYLVGVPKPNAAFTTKNGIRFTHNSLGWRAHEISVPKKKGLKRIVTLGGSSTYCIGVSDDQTWPYRLEEELGPGHEVVNLGVPGYSTVENIIQTALVLSELSPDICIYYLGWNDMRNMHVKGLKSDYSDFHGRSQYDNLVLYTLKFGNRSAAIRFLRKFISKLFIPNREGEYYIEGTEYKFTPKPDPRALGLYKRNVKLLIALCRAQNIRPVMIPQLMNNDLWNHDAFFYWSPYVKIKDTKAAIGFYNDALRETCQSEGADFVQDVLETRFDKSCFVGFAHLSASGNEKFADIVASYLLEHQ